MAKIYMDPSQIIMQIRTWIRYRVTGVYIWHSGQFC